MTNVNKYIIDYTRLVVQRIPQEISFAEVINYVKILVSPVIDLYTSFIAFRTLLIYKLTITPQVVYLEKMLNDRFDNAERRIYILDGLTFDPIYLYTEAELQTVYLYTEAEDDPIYLYTEGEVGSFTFDFVVYVPNAITFNLDEMIGLVRDFKLASKLFTIQTFS